MPKKQFSFYALEQDLVQAISNAESELKFKIVRSGNAQCEFPNGFDSVRELPDMSISRYGDQNREHGYLLVNPTKINKARKVIQRDGQERHIVDQQSHPDSVSLRPGGLYMKGSCLISGQIGTISNEAWALELFNILKSIFRCQFVKIKSFYVGAQAERQFECGLRLTTNVRSPIEYDLRR